MKCLVYITHKMDDAIYRYLSWLILDIRGSSFFKEIASILIRWLCSTNRIVAC